MKNVDFYLSAVKEEMKGNLEITNAHIDYYNEGLSFRKIFLNTPYNEIPEDSI